MKGYVTLNDDDIDLFSKAIEVIECKKQLERLENE